MLAWLEGHGVPFEGSLCPDKTSYPTNRHYLYYSGSELSARDVAPPAPRGHRARGRGTSGGLLYARLAAAVRGSGVRVLAQTTARRLVTGDGGRVTGVECRTLRGAPRPGPGSRTGCCTAGRPSPTCTRPSWAACCTARWPGWSAGTAGRCGSAPAAAW